MRKLFKITLCGLMVLTTAAAKQMIQSFMSRGLIQLTAKVLAVKFQSP